MIIEVLMPVLGLTMEEATIVEWTTAVGDRVTAGETLVVVETDKAVSDVPSPTDGILARIVAEVGQTVPVQELIAYLAESEADMEALPPDRHSAETAPPRIPGVATETPLVRRDGLSASHGAAATTPSPAALSGRVFASPRARIHAAAIGVDLSAVPRSGDRIIKQDVVRAASAATVRTPGARLTPLAARLATELGIDLRHIAASPERRVRAADLLLAASLAQEPASESREKATPTIERVDQRSTAIEAKTPRDGLDGEVVPLTRVRRITAERMSLSARTIPQVTYTARCDVTDALALRRELRDAAIARGVSLPLDVLVIRALATALAEQPGANAQWAGDDRVRVISQVNIGFAVAVEDRGLVVPVVHDAAHHDLWGIASEFDRLLDGAQSGTLGPDDYEGCTFTMSSLSAFGLETFTPLVNPPQAGILGVGSVTSLPVYQRDKLVKRRIANLALTTDHRVLDGAPSAILLARIKEMLESPAQLCEEGVRNG